MSDFIIRSLIASAVLTLVLNALPLLFPRQSRRAVDRMSERLDEELHARSTAEPESRVKVWFPWKAMIVGSIVLTVLVNVAGLLA